MIEPRAALALIPEWNVGDADIEPLQGGLTNHSYRVAHDGRDYVLRLESKQSQLFPIDRSTELRILDAAHSAMLGPRLIYSNTEAGVMLREYLPGRVWHDGDLSSTKQLKALAALVRRVHRLPLSGQPIQLIDKANVYLCHLKMKQSTLR